MSGEEGEGTGVVGATTAGGAEYLVRSCVPVALPSLADSEQPCAPRSVSVVCNSSSTATLVFRRAEERT